MRQSWRIGKEAAMKRKVQKMVSIAMLICMLLTVGNVSSNTDVVVPYAETVTKNNEVN